ncbi:hypothetical protein [Paraburkholderia megapolitana]|uniref:hypothetical protein n=1 Tax=Paraburkholderia megapolitana TaxID=420953 RepID=UPI0038BBBF2B
MNSKTIVEVKRMLRAIYLLAGILLLFAGPCMSSVAVAQETSRSGEARQFFSVPTKAPSFPFSGTELTTSRGETLRYYTSDDSSAVKPLALFIPGSGCNGAFASTSDGHHGGGPEMFALPFSKDVRLVVIDSPGVAGRFARTELQDCSLEFKHMETMQARQSALNEVVQDLDSRGWVIKEHFMLVASSEGVPIATRFAAEHPQVSHLLLNSGFGVSQVYDSLHGALTGWGNWSFSANPSASSKYVRGQAVLNQWSEIERNSKSVQEIAGHSAAYWRTIGMDSPADDVFATEANLYVAQGAKDQSFAPGSFEAGLNELIAHRRPFVAEYFECGDHLLICAADGGEPKNLEGFIHRGITWFLSGKIDHDAAISYGEKETR